MKKEILVKRVLIAQSERGSTVEEIKILKFSPSGKWVKIQIEVLKSIENPEN